MSHQLHSLFLGLERIQGVLSDEISLDELHVMLDELMQKVLSCYGQRVPGKTRIETDDEQWLEELLEGLTYICIELFNEQRAASQHLLVLVEKARWQIATRPASKLSTQQLPATR